ncbi:MAG: histone deacetylase [Pirellulales bacterium]
MTLLYYDDTFLKHDTGRHPERGLRLRSVIGRLRETGLLGRCDRVDWASANDRQLARVHDLDYVRSVRQFAADGGGRIEQDTVVAPASYAVAQRAAGAVCDAVDRVVGGEHQHALCLVRPPGHHALPASAMGFCLLNNIAVGALQAVRELQLDRVLVIDWDVHHGNGTQDMFWENEQVAFFSIHRWPFYPGSGGADETGAARGLGATRNLPVEFGTSRSAYLQRFETELNDFASRVKPQLVLVSAGFDSHREDPVGSLGLEVEDFEQLTKIVLSVADQYAAGRLVSVLEGGYNPDVLAQCVEVHLRGLF